MNRVVTVPQAGVIAYGCATACLHLVCDSVQVAAVHTDPLKIIATSELKGLNVTAPKYHTKFGSLAHFEKGGVQSITDDVKHYAFSNCFDIASRARPSL